MPKEDQQQELSLQLEMPGYYLSQVHETLGTEVGQSVYERMVERAQRPAMGVRKMVKAD